MSNTKTAVEWLYDSLFPKQLDGFSQSEWDKIDSAFKQAKQMEKEQITTAWCEGNDAEPKEVTMDFAEEYYTQTYEN